MPPPTDGRAKYQMQAAQTTTYRLSLFFSAFKHDAQAGFIRACCKWFTYPTIGHRGEYIVDNSGGWFLFFHWYTLQKLG